MRVREALGEIGIDVDIRPDYGYRGVRSYRFSSAKIRRVLDFQPRISVEESVKTMVGKIDQYGYDDFANPRYYNIQWMRLLEEAARVIAVTDALF